MRGSSNVEAVQRYAQINVGKHQIGTTCCLGWPQRLILVREFCNLKPGIRLLG